MLDRRHLLLSLGAAALARPSLAQRSQDRPGQPTRFSDAALGKTAPGHWRHQPLPKVERSNEFAIVPSPAGGTAQPAGHVLHGLARSSASSWVSALDADAGSTPLLRWAWRVERSLPASDFSSKAGDDYAARVYVLFDRPSAQLSLGTRLRHAAAQLLSPLPLPTAAICYVWGGPQQAPGSTGWNPYTETVRMVVVDSGDGHAGQWRSVQRDLRQDWQQAFGGPLPRINGLALGLDTDNAGGEAQAWFGDLSLVAA